MKRRNILLGGASIIAASAISRTRAFAQSAAVPDASRLNSAELTPMGSERAASASGLVPAWTGGVSTSPPGWSPGMNPPNLFPDQAPLFTVTVDNMSKYADMLCDGQMQLLKRFGGEGFKIIVYPSARTFAAPQSVYDNTKLNVTRAQPLPEGLVYGFTGAVGGTPFPILSADPLIAGEQIIWNHQTRWQGTYYSLSAGQWIVSNGQINLAVAESLSFEFPYYAPGVTPENFGGDIFHSEFNLVAPPNQAGGKDNSRFTTTPRRRPNVAYEYLVGEGRIRQAPNAEYDLPAVETNDSINYDEVYVFNGSMDRYTWKLVGKKEMIVPYNSYNIYHTQITNDSFGPHFVKPELIRFEVHRCYVVEAHLAPGKRMSEPFRRFYVDEDSWVAVMSDSYDDQGNYWKYNYINLAAIPEVPCIGSIGQQVYNFQSNEYVILNSFYDAPPPIGSTISFSPISDATFDPQTMADSGAL